MAGMRCAELVEPGKPLVLTQHAIPEPPPKGLVVKTKFAGMCHWELHMQDDKVMLDGDSAMLLTSTPGYNLPLVCGHEISGVIHSLGSDTTPGGSGLALEDNVLVYPWVGCYQDACGLCRGGQSQLCETWTKTLGNGAPGGYSTYVSVPATRFAVKVPENVPMDTAALLPCSGLTAYNAVNLVKPTIDKMACCKGRASLLIIGAGGLGMWCVQIARAMLLNTTIIVANRGKDKLETARKHGADKTVLWNDDEERDIIARTQQAGENNEIHAVIDFVTTPETANRGNNCLVKGGTLVCVGTFGGSLNLSLPLVALQARKILGCYVGSLSQLRDLVTLVSEKQILAPPKEYVKLDNVNDALDRLRAGKINGRCIIQHD